LLCDALALYQTPIILALTTVMLVIKYVPACLYTWRAYSKHRICLSETLVTVLSVWPFHLLAIVFIPAGVALFDLGFVLCTVVHGYYEVVRMLCVDHAPLCTCVAVPLVEIRMCDKRSEGFLPSGIEILSNECCPCYTDDDDDDEESGHRRPANSSSAQAEIQDAAVYWDRFAS